MYGWLIFTVSSLPHPEEFAPALFQFTSDKLLHGIEYGILGILCYRAFRQAAGPWARSYALGLAILTAAAYGVSDEIHQAFIPSRESSGWDVLADGVGAAIAACGWHWCWKVEAIFHQA
jgi:VanZ family protein